jgi:hypothetical protein
MLIALKGKINNKLILFNYYIEMVKQKFDIRVFQHFNNGDDCDTTCTYTFTDKTTVDQIFKKFFRLCGALSKNFYVCFMIYDHNEMGSINKDIETSFERHRVYNDKGIEMPQYNLLQYEVSDDNIDGWEILKLFEKSLKNK